MTLVTNLSTGTIDRLELAEGQSCKSTRFVLDLHPPADYGSASTRGRPSSSNAPHSEKAGFSTLIDLDFPKKLNPKLPGLSRQTCS
ncbi:hypothetical protein RRG08_066254 [Elysia crispata]|uniref:Uncharacterized protein n=1 Tax=Elysia crispata TaxID=231223 RepID=A0AAE1BDA5_9GAST|nr:hypothetical protein RRG08_066254 [Elysia crispata]